jgi:hypothetical protein
MFLSVEVLTPLLMDCALVTLMLERLVSKS